MMKTALVTGGTVRVGRAIAEGLRAAGWRVLVSSHRAEAGADVVADLSQPMGAARLYAAVLRLNGGLPPDLLVNNAALFAGEAALLDAVNRAAPQKLTMLMAGRESSRGCVVNVLDSCALQSAATPTPYVKSKSEMLAYTRKAALLFAETLNVNAVAPGPVVAPVGVHVKAGEMLCARPTLADVAQAVVFLASMSSVTGCVLPVDGGQHLLETP